MALHAFKITLRATAEVRRGEGARSKRADKERDCHMNRRMSMRLCAIVALFGSVGCGAAEYGEGEGELVAESQENLDTSRSEAGRRSFRKGLSHPTRRSWRSIPG